MRSSRDDIPPWSAGAMTSDGEEPVPGIRVREVTAGVLAVLQRIRSPYAGGGAPDEAAGYAPWIGTVYAMTRPAAESWAALEAGAFDARALAFADSLRPADFDALLGATARSVRRLREASLAGGDASGGEDDDADPPPAATDGPSASPRPRASASGSGSERRGTACRSPSSSSSAASPAPRCPRTSLRIRQTRNP